MLLALVRLEGIGGSPRQPNILLVLTDDQRWDAIGASGNPSIHTPVIDSLASQGVYFRQAVTHMSLCCPSRASLLTGLAVSQHGCFHNRRQVSRDGELLESFGGPTMPERFQDVGYRTVLIGKWHLTPMPWNCGFDEVRTWLPGGSTPNNDPFLARGRSTKLAPIGGWTTEILFEDAIEFLESAAAKEKPFFLWLSTIAPHLKFTPNPDHIEARYAGKSEEDLRPPGFTQEPWDYREAWLKLSHNKQLYRWGGYYAAVSHIDEQLGRLLAVLDEQQLAADTVVVFASDNGFMMGRRGWYDKSLPYDDSVRVPLIIHAPMIDGPARVSDAAVSTLDLPVTLLSLAGIPVPDEWPGTDLVPLLQGDESRAPEAAFCTNQRRLGIAPFRLVRTTKYKLVSTWDGRLSFELYDLEQDAGEIVNVYGDPEYTSVRKDMRRHLESWLSRTGEAVDAWMAAPAKKTGLSKQSEESR